MRGIVADNFLTSNDFWEIPRQEFLDPSQSTIPIMTKGS